MIFLMTVSFIVHMSTVQIFCVPQRPTNPLMDPVHHLRTNSGFFPFFFLFSFFFSSFSRNDIDSAERNASERRFDSDGLFLRSVPRIDSYPRNGNLRVSLFTDTFNVSPLHAFTLRNRDGS